MWILTDTLIERLTFCVYGKAIQMIDIRDSCIYDVVASRLDYDDDNLLAAIEIGFISQANLDILLQDICAKGMIEPGKYEYKPF